MTELVLLASASWLKAYDADNHEVTGVIVDSITVTLNSTTHDLETISVTYNADTAQADIDEVHRIRIMADLCLDI